VRIAVIIVATAVLLGAGVMLWRMTHDMDDAGATPTKTTKRDEPPAPVAAAPAESSTAPKRDARIAPVQGPQARIPQRPVASTSGGAAPALEAGSGSAEAPVSPARVIERDLKRQLIKQLDALDGPVTDCVAKHGRGKPTGAVALLVKIEKQKTGNAAVVEVGVEPIDTTVKNQPLLDCLAATGKKISIDLPEPVTEMTATHQVNLDAGSVIGHDLTAYDFKPWGRPVDPPTTPSPATPPGK
jgi:hypothetical protein